MQDSTDVNRILIMEEEMKVCLWCMPCMEDRQCHFEWKLGIFQASTGSVHWMDARMAGWHAGWPNGRMAGRIWQDGTMALKRMALHLSFKMFMSSFSGYNLLSAMRAGGYYHYVLIHSRQIFFTKKLSNMMPEGSALAICHCRRVLWSRETRLLGLRSPSNVVSVYRRNFM